MNRERPEAGMATAELAVAIPAVLLVLAMCLSGLTLALDQVRCVDAARAGARAASRGETVADVRSVVEQLTPDGSTVDVQFGPEADEVRVRVQGPERARWLPGLPRADAEAQAPLEPVLQQG